MERLQKVLAQAGIASRRKCEALITDGRVAVDGEVCTELGTKVNPYKQQISVDGKVIVLEQKMCVILHKPTSYVTTVRDPEGRRTVMELVQGVEERVYPIGRLDYETSGLLLLTNDGELTNMLLHPSHHVDKVYRATVLGMIDKETVRRLEQGVQLEDGMTLPATVSVLRKHPLESVVDITIHEGRNRQVRRMFETVGFPVKRLKRLNFGPLSLGNLQPGKWRFLTKEEWEALYSSVQLTPPPYPSLVTALRKRVEPRKDHASATARRSKLRGKKRVQHLSRTRSR